MGIVVLRNLVAAAFDSELLHAAAQGIRAEIQEARCIVTIGANDEEVLEVRIRQQRLQQTQGRRGRPWEVIEDDHEWVIFRRENKEIVSCDRRKLLPRKFHLRGH